MAILRIVSVHHVTAHRLIKMMQVDPHFPLNNTCAADPLIQQKFNDHLVTGCTEVTTQSFILEIDLL